MSNRIVLSVPTVYEKGWGREHWIANNDKYCGKILEFDAGKCGSLHFHIVKQESWCVLSGQFLLDTIDGLNAERTSHRLAPSDVVHIAPGVPHKLHALTAGKIMEVSTTHDDLDTYRIEPGASQSTPPCPT